MKGLLYFAVVLVFGAGSIVQWMRSKKRMRKVLAEGDAPIPCRLTTRSGRALFSDLGQFLDELQVAGSQDDSAVQLHGGLDEYYTRQARRQELVADIRGHIKALDDSDRAEVASSGVDLATLRTTLELAQNETDKALLKARAELAKLVALLRQPDQGPSVAPYR